MIRPGRQAEPQAEVLPDWLAGAGQAAVLMALPPLAQEELAAPPVLLPDHTNLCCCTGQHRAGVFPAKNGLMPFSSL